MSSQKRIEANRANSLHSTGPATPEGKANASRNATRHGLLSREVVLRTEDRAEFVAFRDRMAADLAPDGELEETLAERVAGQWWRLKRVARMEAVLVGRDLANPADAGTPYSIAAIEYGVPGVAADGAALAKTLGSQFCPYETLRRYERTIERGLEGTMRQFREAQKLRAQRPPSPEEDDLDPQDPGTRKLIAWLTAQAKRAVEELVAAYAAAESAGVKLPTSSVMEGMKRDEERRQRFLAEHADDPKFQEYLVRKAVREAEAKAAEQEAEAQAAAQEAEGQTAAQEPEAQADPVQEAESQAPAREHESDSEDGGADKGSGSREAGEETNRREGEESANGETPGRWENWRPELHGRDKGQ